jgi:hypothetical protein
VVNRCDTSSGPFAAIALVLAGPTAYGAVTKPANHPGYLSLQPFLDLAGPDDDVVEVNVGPELLRSLTQAVEDPEARKMMGDMVAIHAVVLGLTGDDVSTRLDRRGALVADTTKRLHGRGLGIHRAREGKDLRRERPHQVGGAEGKVHGLAVLVVETDEDEPQIVFANIAGNLDMAQIRKLSSGSGLKLDLPGLDQLGK